VFGFERTVTPMTQRGPRADPVRLLALAVVALLMVVVARTAWVSDDAFITFRTVEHVLAGRGPIWNPDQRVQVYTHPLWMFLLAGVTPPAGGPYAASLVLSGLCTLGAGLLVALGGPAGAVAVALLAVSKAFTDFATSGLETPLTYLLLAAFLLLFLARELTARRLLALAALAGLGLLNRLDTALLFLPPLAFAAFTHGRTAGWGRTLGLVALGLSPMALWEGFSLLYYGVLFPNTAYAKLGTGIPAADLLVQGGRYLADSLVRDPVTLPTILLGVAIPFVRRDGKGIAAAVGVLLYVAYTVKIGGDFMSGRFLAAPLLAAAVLIARVPLRLGPVPRPTLAGAAVVAVVVLGAIPPASPLRGGPDYADRTLRHGIADERGWYFQALGLLNGRHGLPEGFDTKWPARFKALTDAGRSFVAVPDRAAGDWRMLELPHRDPPLGLVVQGRVGRFAYGVGPRVYVIDTLGLGDPFLARLPAKGATTGSWRIGHFARAVPMGYPESILQGRNRLVDPDYARLYADLVLATRAPLFAPGRLGAIWRLNTGAYAGLPGPKLEPPVAASP
jgi:arabinofuranosyltransferase